MNLLNDNRFRLKVLKPAFHVKHNTNQVNLLQNDTTHIINICLNYHMLYQNKK